MPDIIKIVLKGRSGYFESDEGYEDTLVLTSSSIIYEYCPLVTNKNDNYKQWSYQTTSPVFQKIYDEVAAKTLHFLHKDKDLFAFDCEMTRIITTFRDKHKESVTYYYPRQFLFIDYFKSIMKMVPPCEETPYVITWDDTNL